MNERDVKFGIEMMMLRLEIEREATAAQEELRQIQAGKKAADKPEVIQGARRARVLVERAEDLLKRVNAAGGFVDPQLSKSLEGMKGWIAHERQTLTLLDLLIEVDRATSMRLKPNVFAATKGEA